MFLLYARVTTKIPQTLSPAAWYNLAARLLQDDPLCRQVVQDTIGYLLTALATSINVVDPDAVVFGGKLNLLRPFLEETARLDLHRRIFANPIRDIPFLFTTLSDQAPLLGASALVVRDLFQNPQNMSVA